MPGHSLAAYTIVVRRRYARGRDIEQVLGNFNDEGTALLPVLERYLAELHFVDEDRNMNLQAVDVSRPDGQDHVIAAFLDAGQYGVTSRIRDRTGKQEPFDRTYDHLEDLETLVLVKAPPRRKVGTLIVHIPHRRGIKGSLTQALVERFRKEYSDFGLHLDTAVPAEVIQQTIDNGRVTKVRFVRRRPRTDEFDRIGEYLDDPAEGSVETVVNTSRLGALKKRNFERVIKKEAELGSLLSFGGREYDTVKIEVDVEGKMRTIDVGAQSIGRVTWDVTEDLDYNKGKPTRESLVASAIDLVDTIERSTGAR